ncbi:MAG: hypothetical protein U9N56_00065 [Actinomycetota bacterium]|nr:hypothetical protein [Actinomycetota bacterium]
MSRGMAAAIGAMALLVASCSGGDVAERIIEGQEGVGDVEVNEDDGSVKIEIEDEEGDISASFGAGEIPDGFPIDVPNGGSVMAVVEQSDDATVSLSYNSSEFDSIVGFYEDWIAGTGSEVVNKLEVANPKSVAWTVEDGDSRYSISVSDTGSEIFVNLFVDR